MFEYVKICKLNHNIAFFLKKIFFHMIIGKSNIQKFPKISNILHSESISFLFPIYFMLEMMRNVCPETTLLITISLII